MNQKELCLEDYLAFLRESRTVDVVLVDNSRYQIIYYAPSENVLVPEGRSYTTSGDNMGGTIVTVKY